MKNIKLTIEYDGTDFCGWQIQPNGVSVQGLIKEALQKIENKDITPNGAGRTDSGVHALGQVANFITDSNIAPSKYKDALNSHLPESVRILESTEVPIEFNSRFSAKHKTYQYRIRNSNTASALSCRYEYLCPGSLNIENMQKACKHILGTHDFKAFMASGSSVKDTVRTIYSSEFNVNIPNITYEVCGNGFLYKMVRLLTGTLIEIGKGRHSPEYMLELLNTSSNKRATFAVPAKGLFMHSITYD